MSNEQNTVLYTARRNRLNEGLRTISDWCAKRADDDLFRGYEAQLDKVMPMSERWIFATAAQRAEAFLRTLNLWEE